MRMNRMRTRKRKRQTMPEMMPRWMKGWMTEVLTKMGQQKTWEALPRPVTRHRCRDLWL